MSQNRRDTRAASKSRSGEETEHDDNPDQTNFEDFVRSTLTSLGSKIDQLLTGQTVLEEKVSGLETRVNTNTLTIGNITESLEFESENIKDLTSEIHELKSNLQTRDSELEHAKCAISTMQSEINSLERYTRGFNIRIMGMHEEEEEDCVASVQKLLQDLFDIAGPVIENAHRVGPAKEGRPRQMIARFHSRASRRDVMSKAREKLQNTPYRIVDDLTAKDLDEKRRLLPLMNKLYQEKKRPRFANGRLYAGGKPVSREVINAFLSTQ